MEQAWENLKNKFTGIKVYCNECKHYDGCELRKRWRMIVNGEKYPYCTWPSKEYYEKSIFEEG